MSSAVVEREDAPCPLGCERDDRILLTGGDRLHGSPGRFDVVECRQCGLKRTNPRPTPEAIGLYYPDDYGPYQGTTIDPAPNSGSVSFRRSAVGFAKRFFDTKAQSLPPQPAGRMLEIGCASGSFLEIMKRRGWHVEGIEYSDIAAQRAIDHGHKVTIGAIESIEMPSDQFDLVVGWMVVEHVHEPVAALRKLAQWSKPTAKLAISVPDQGAVEARIFGDRWYALQLPTHLYHYDADSIRKVLASGGWRVMRIERHRTLSNLVASIGYTLKDRGLTKAGDTLIAFPERGGRLGALLLFPFAWVAAKLGQTGRMTVWAEKLDT